MVVLFALLLLSGLPAEVRRVISGVGLVTSGVAAGWSFALRARQTDGRRRRSWNLFAVAAMLGAASNLLAVLIPPGPHAQAISYGNICLALALLIGVIALTTFPLARRRGTDLARMVLDGTVISGSILFIASMTLFPQILTTRGSGGALVLLVPVIDIVIATLATLLFLRGARNDRPTLGLAAFGFGCFAVSDFAYAVIAGRTGSFTFGTILDLGWIAGYVLIALAVRTPTSRATPHGERPVEASPILGTTVMFALFLAGAVLSLFSLRQGTLSTPTAALWVLVLGAILVRQILLVVDNERLRRELSRSLRQITERSDLLVNAVGDGIYGVDRDGLITFVNPAAARVLGYPPDLLTGREAHVMFHALDPTGAPFPTDTCYITEAIREGVVTNAEDDLYLRADGQPVPVEVTATPLYEEGRATGAVVVFRDVTQRREVDRLKGEFVSVVSHELRTPLTAIRGSLGLIAGGALGPLTPAAGRMVEIALISSERLTRLINEILDIERIESGVIAMELSEHTAASLIDTAVGQVQIIAENADVRVQVRPAEGELTTDPDRVVQTLLNLLDNAIKFSSAGSTVSVGAERRGELVEFSVSDRGRGVPEDKLDAIFGRFEQVDSSDARDKGGSGLGLAISRSIIERLGGRIWATNNPGGGATLRFTLPARRPAARGPSPPTRSKDFAETESAR